MDVSGHVHFVLANANVQLQTLLKSYPGPINLVAIQVTHLIALCLWLLIHPH